MPGEIVCHGSEKSDTRRSELVRRLAAHALSQIYETPSSSGEMAPEHCPLILWMIAANAFPLAERRHR
jgi:hypothetical protein